MKILLFNYYNSDSQDATIMNLAMKNVGDGKKKQIRVVLK
jgi:hypothetical protein